MMPILNRCVLRKGPKFGCLVPKGAALMMLLNAPEIAILMCCLSNANLMVLLWNGKWGLPNVDGQHQALQLFNFQK
jgi:hypothetical protein